MLYLIVSMVTFSIGFLSERTVRVFEERLNLQLALVSVCNILIVMINSYFANKNGLIVSDFGKFLFAALILMGVLSTFLLGLCVKKQWIASKP